MKVIIKNINTGRIASVHPKAAKVFIRTGKFELLEDKVEAKLQKPLPVIEKAEKKKGRPKKKTELVEDAADNEDLAVQED